MSDQKDAFLSVANISISFGGLKAVDDVSFQLTEGKIQCIIGPNGAGKTTLFNLLTGFLKPDAGSIHMSGKNITGWEPYRINKEGIARSFQLPQLVLEYTVLENLRVATNSKAGQFSLARFSKNISEKEETILSLFNLYDYAELPASALSHGYKRCLDIAMALATEPKLLLLDEPTAGMTISEAEIMIDMCKNVSNYSTLLLIEHNLDVVRKLADIVFVLHRGSIISQGDVQHVSQDKIVQDVYLGGEVLNAEC